MGEPTLSPSGSQLRQARPSFRTPRGVHDDVLGGELLPLDLAVLGLVVLTITTGRIGDYQAAAGNARFAEDGTLVMRGRGRWLIEDIDAGSTSTAERVLSLRLDAILDRLARREWLAVERHGGTVHLRPGGRLAELDPERAGKVRGR